MFPVRYFPAEYFAPRYFPEVGLDTIPGGRLYSVVATPTNTYSVTAEPGNAYSVVAVPSNAYSATASLHMATTLNIQCYRAEQVTVTFTVTGLASLSGIPFYWNLVDESGTVLETLSTASGDITVSGGTGTLVIPDTVTDRTADVYLHALGRTDSPTMEVTGRFWIKSPMVPQAA